MNFSLKSSELENKPMKAHVRDELPLLHKVLKIELILAPLLTTTNALGQPFSMHEVLAHSLKSETMSSFPANPESFAI